MPLALRASGRACLSDKASNLTEKVNLREGSYTDSVADRRGGRPLPLFYLFYSRVVYFSKVFFNAENIFSPHIFLFQISEAIHEHR